MKAMITADGLVGTVVWQEACYLRRKQQPNEWLYVAYVPDRSCDATLTESDLVATGNLDSDSNFPGHRFEISYDLLMDDDMIFVEGTFGVPGKSWQVIGFH